MKRAHRLRRRTIRIVGATFVTVTVRRHSKIRTYPHFCATVRDCRVRNRIRCPSACLDVDMRPALQRPGRSPSPCLNPRADLNSSPCLGRVAVERLTERRVFLKFAHQHSEPVPKARSATRTCAVNAALARRPAAERRARRVHTRSRTWVVAATTRRPNH